MNLSIEEIKTLVEESQGNCVSLYMPMVKAGPEIRQNPIRLKNLIKAAEAKLQENELSKTEALKLLEPVLELDNENFWDNQKEGLAIFVNENFLNYYLVPLDFEELVVVSDRFHIKPLMPLLVGDGEFYILALSQKQVRLFVGTRYSVTEIELEDVPTSLEEALQLDEIDQDLQNRISTSKGGTNNSAQQAGVFHGQGSPDTDDNRRLILQFFHQLDKGIQKYLKNKKAPIVLIGVEYLFPIYKEASTSPNILYESNTGSPKILKLEEIHEQTWPIVEPYFAQAQEEAIAEYAELSNTDKTSADIKETIPAAYYGRVDQLFVAVGKQQWGNFDPETNQLEIHLSAEPGDSDLLNDAAIQTLLNGGKVYAVQPEEVPDGAPLAAIFRY